MNMDYILHIFIFICCSGLLLDAFAERWKDAVSRAPAACRRYSACWIPVSGHQEGTVIFLSVYPPQPRLEDTINHIKTGINADPNKTAARKHVT